MHYTDVVDVYNNWTKEKKSKAEVKEKELNKIKVTLLMKFLIPIVQNTPKRNPYLATKSQENCRDQNSQKAFACLPFLLIQQNSWEALQLIDQWLTMISHNLNWTYLVINMTLAIEYSYLWINHNILLRVEQKCPPW